MITDHRHRPDVLVVGGGVIGAAILFELARRGIAASLIERGRLGRESTGKSAAIVRMHYSNAPVVRMALRSRAIFRNFPSLTEAGPVYHETGWCFAVPDENVDAVRATAAMNSAEGVEVVEVEPDDVSDLYPGLVSEGVGALFFESGSGFADPHATTLGYVKAARALGATADESIAALRLVVKHGRLMVVETTGGTIAPGIVVLAAGPWSARLAATAGLELPFRVTREQELYLDVPEHLRPRAPMSDLVDRIYFRPMPEWNGSSEAMIVGRGFPKPYEDVNPESHEEELSPEFEEDVRERLGRRVPALVDCPRVGGVVGLYAVTPDWHPYLGEVSGFENLILATGGSGHCFKLAPAIGEMVAAAIVGDSVDYADVDLFNISRISAGRLLTAAIGGNRA